MRMYAIDTDITDDEVTLTAPDIGFGEQVITMSLSQFKMINEEVTRRKPPKRKKELAGIQFTEFWQKVPKKVDKMSAQKVWERLPESCREVACTDIQIRYKDREKMYIPSPARYLRNRSWEDELVVEVAQEAAIKLPYNDDALMPFAQAHDLPMPGVGMSFRDYRAILSSKMELRQ